jgi:hypothetical protein
MFVCTAKWHGLMVSPRCDEVSIHISGSSSSIMQEVASYGGIIGRL